MSTLDFITKLFSAIDDVLQDVPKHSHFIYARIEAVSIQERG